jgi:hypothetical protein
MGIFKSVGKLAMPFGGTNAAADALSKLGGPKVPGSSAASLLEQLSAKFYNQTDPIRKSLIDRSTNFLSGNLDVTQSPIYGSLKAANDAQFKTAKDNALSMLPGGGGLTAALVDLEGQKASNMTSAIGSLANDELGRAYGFANPQTSLAGLGGAAQIQSQQATAQAQQRAAAKQGIGSGIGAILGGK